MAAAMTAALLAPTAPAQAGPLRCPVSGTMDYGHTYYKRCEDGPNAQYGGKYAVNVQFCGPSGCWRAQTDWELYGHTASMYSTYGTYSAGSAYVKTQS